MPFKLEGSCHCGKVKYSCDSNTPYPYQHCTCSICRKVGGFMGSVNIMGLTSTLTIEGEEYLKSYTPKGNGIAGPIASKRFFCGECGSMLWLHDDTWKEWVYPFASSIDVTLPTPPEILVVLRASCPKYVPIPEGAETEEAYREESIEDWHKKRGLWID
ncbi:hypothetical protein BOTBODRAFT_26085 [Botryobasidium botryosum FD-172 SS1]|uniref:CENP-V/GFA domain-containing protein n=1 Tax=Botryobasidium botryosum (strain FD-172 SS1) TaxID=930990 RepID=A0A067N1B7_BOTB1|nr:hypothetical protein BOTBODRAFT_26085 [Botryobasidium botryosum FD-172 SS1]